MKKIILLFFVFVLSLSTVFGTFFSPLLAENPEITIYVAPLISTANQGGVFSVNITVANVLNLYAYEFRLSWEPSLLDLTSVAEGPFLNAEGTYMTIFTPRIYNTPDPFGISGYVYVACTLLGEPATAAASGSGTLAVLEFLVEEEGSTSLHLYDTRLISSLMVEISHTTKEGYYRHAFFTYSPMTPSVGEETTFNASLSFTLDGRVISYYWVFDDGNISSTVDSTIVHVYEFASRYNVTLTVFDIGGSNSSYSESVLVKMPTSISISASSSSTYVGYRLNVTGTLCDTHGNGLENEIVVLSYTFSGIGTWNPITSDVTNSLGQYFAMWIPPATGYFIVKAEWAGNTTHYETNNTVALSSLPYNNQYVFSVESNSTISELAFNTTDWTLRFSAIGPSGTKGYTKITVAKTLVENIANIRVYLDGNQSEYSIASIDDSWLLTFDYIHSSHQVVLDLDIDIIPEFSSFLIILLFMIATLLVVACIQQKIQYSERLKRER